MLFLVAGIVLICIGLTITVLFWVPGVFDRHRFKEILGPRYPIIFFVYSANGPFVLLAGILLVVRYILM